jgi:putative methylase
LLRRSELVRALEQVSGFAHPAAASEQVITPSHAAAELLYEATARGDLHGRTVVDLGSGTGRLAIGAALLGAQKVTGVEQDREAVRLAEENAERAGVECVWVVGPVTDYDQSAETVIMNPPFGAQRRHADAPFWNRAFTLAERAIYAFSLADSRNFIPRRALARAARIETSRPVRWDLPATFPHHRKPRVPLSVDLWVLRTEKTNR